MNNNSNNLDRFVSAQVGVFERVLAELRNGQKRTHWMWFIFPQIDGLGHSTTSKHYSIKSEEEARQYLNHPILGARLLKCAEVTLAIDGKSVLDIFGSPDDKKFKSSMTLFAYVTHSDSVFAHVLEKYFNGKRDKRTIYLLAVPSMKKEN